MALASRASPNAFKARHSFISSAIPMIDVVLFVLFFLSIGYLAGSVAAYFYKRAHAKSHERLLTHRVIITSKGVPYAFDTTFEKAKEIQRMVLRAISAKLGGNLIETISKIVIIHDEDNVIATFDPNLVENIIIQKR